MKLMKIIIQEFKGIKNLELDINGQSLNIFGDNAAGKTTIFDAFTWALFHKDSEDKAVFDIKRRSENSEELPFIDHGVTVIFDTITFEKIYKEEWTKKKGNTKKEFTGHTNDYFINNVPVSKTDYDKKVLEVLGNEKKVKTLSNPLYFNNNLSWQERREALINLVGDVEIEEIIASEPGFKELPKVLNNNSIDDAKKILQATKTKINKQLQEIPARIDELSRSIPQECEQSLESLCRQLKAIADEKSEINQAIAGLKNGEVQSQIKQELNAVKEALADLECSNRQNTQEQTQKFYDELEALKKEQSQIKFTPNKQEDLLAQKMQVESDINSLRAEFKLKAQEEFSTDTICPVCRQEYPAEQMQTKQADFNSYKAKKLEDINQKGKQLKLKLEQIEQEISENQDKLNMDSLVIKGYQDKQKQLTEQIDKVQADNKLETDPLYSSVLKRKQELEQKLVAVNADSIIIEKQTELEQKIFELDKQETAIQTVIAQKNQITTLNKRIDELKAEEKRLSDEFMQCCEHLQLIEDYIIAKVRLLTDKINANFKTVQFQLFDKQVDGGLVECCQAVVGGARYGKGLNRGAMINAGLEIISVLSNNSGVTVPIFIDNAEAVTKFIDVNAQVIKLIVSKQDKKLRIEAV